MNESYYMSYFQSLTYDVTAKSSKIAVLTQIVLCSFLIALCAQIRIPLFFTPVPLTLQTLAVLFVGCKLGSRNGSLSVILYLAESMMGLPVLSGGRADMLALFSPVGGYLVGFVVQAYLAGWFMERKAILGKTNVFGGLMIACLVQLFCGFVWLGGFVGMTQGFILGVLPFVPGEMLKVIAVSACLLRSK